MAKAHGQANTDRGYQLDYFPAWLDATIERRLTERLIMKVKVPSGLMCAPHLPMPGNGLIRPPRFSEQGG